MQYRRSQRLCSRSLVCVLTSQCVTHCVGAEAATQQLDDACGSIDALFDSGVMYVQRPPCSS